MIEQARRLSRFLVKRQRDGALGVLFSSSSVVVVKMGKAWLCETRDAGIKSGLTCGNQTRGQQMTDWTKRHFVLRTELSLADD